ncbi:MAG: phenylalanine--tRNA ligase subunit beta [Bacteroidales bacterium]|nr:phenylalanine--tRNA ligase subunit beta [Candidatus Equibacterium intestinale]
MTISYNWLKDYLKFDLTPAQVSQILTSTGLEVEHEETVEQIPGGLAGVVVAHVLECVEHPDSDHLHITKLDIGEAEPLQVVCGAPNVAAGQKVMLATVGTTLVDIHGEELKLKKSKIRGVESFGMICAQDELGIGEDHAGIMVLDPAAVPGTPAKDYLQLKSDTVYEIGLTPNRVDGASHIGVARDLYAYCKLNGIAAEWTLPEPAVKLKGAGEAVPVEVQAPELAPRYIGITIKGVKVAPSPEWLRDRLNAVGQRPINNIVDITNFILNEYCQPLHVFDLAKIDGGKVIVRTAKEGEKIVTLDGVERTLTTADLVIANANEPMCIAGVFGGDKSGVTESTTDVFLEVAYFNPVSIRKTSKRFALKTDASFRYERGIDPCNTMVAARRAADLIVSLAGGQIVGEPQEFYPVPFKKAEVDMEYGRIFSLIGKNIGVQTVKDILKYLEFEILSENEAGCRVAVPAYRVDVTRECDVIEEILRIYGYNNIELPVNMKMSVQPTPHPDPEAIRQDISNFFTNKGFLEIMNNSLTKSAYYTKLQTWPEANCVKLLNPLSADLNCMRQTLIMGALETVSFNIKHQVNSVRMYEIGNVYSYTPSDEPQAGANLKNYHEELKIALVISSPAVKAWRNEIGEGAYFELKGYVELLTRRFGMNLYDMEAAPAPADIFSEGLTYSLQGRPFATFGVVNKAMMKAFDIKQPVFVAEISWKTLMEVIRRNKVKYSELPKYPEVKRDLALLVDENVSFADLRKSALQCEKGLLKSVSLFDVYRGDKIPEGKKQYALNFVLQNPEQTLTDEAVERIMNKLLSTFEHKFGATLR